MAQGKDWEKIANGLSIRVKKLTDENRKLKEVLRQLQREKNEPHHSD